MPPQEDADSVDLRYYLRVVRRRKWMIMLFTVVTVLAAVGASLAQTPLYEATAQVLVSTNADQSVFDPMTGQRNDPQRAVATEIQVLESTPIRAAVRREIGRVPPKVEGSAVGETDVIAVKVTHPRPAEAARIADTYAKVYIKARRDQAVDSLLEAGEEIQQKVSDLDRQIATIDAQAAALSQAQQNGPQGQALTARRTTVIQQQALFKQKLDQLQVDAALKDGGAQLVTPAETPTSPSSPQPVRNAILALLVGLMLGVGVAFLRERLDDTIKTKEDLEATVGGLPVLGLIPAVAQWKDEGRELVITEVDPNSLASEAYRTLRTSVQFIGLDRPLKTVQVTSPSAAEGKSTTLANLAVTLARAGLRVIVVDCDLRRPRVHRFFELSNEVGFTSVILGHAPVSDALQPVPQEERLSLLASGPVPPNPSELLAGRRTVEVLASLQTLADIVLIDCPPVLPVTDAVVLSARVDATLLVTTSGKTSNGALQRSMELLRQVDAPLIGVVLNAIRGGDAYGYSYGYGGAPYARDTKRAAHREKTVGSR